MSSASARAATLLKPVRGLRLLTSALIVLSVIISLAGAWSTWDAYFLATAFAEDGSVGFSEVLAADERTMAIGWIDIAVVIVAGIAFIVWLVRARANAEWMCVAEHNLPKGWAIGSWFVPIFNLWLPYQVVRDVWKASKPENLDVQRPLKTVPGSPAIALWWALWVIATLIDRFGSAGEPQDLDDIQAIAILHTFVTVLTAAAGVVILRVMAEISGWQEQARRSAA